MKKLSYLAIPLLLLFSVGMLGCPASNYFGGSFDIVRVCGDNTCSSSGTAGATNPPVYINDFEPLIRWFEFSNNMRQPGAEAGTGITVRTRTVEIEYVAANGQALPTRTEGYVQNFEAGEERIEAITIFSYEQQQYIQDNASLFPDYPFQVSLNIKVKYDTSGGQTSSVERLYSVQVLEERPAEEGDGGETEPTE